MTPNEVAAEKSGTLSQKNYKKFFLVNTVNRGRPKGNATNKEPEREKQEGNPDKEETESNKNYPVNLETSGQSLNGVGDHC